MPMTVNIQFSKLVACDCKRVNYTKQLRKQQEKIAMYGKLDRA